MVFIETCLHFKYCNNPIPGITTAEEEEFCAADTILAEPDIHDVA
jgi:hypothetical protein